MSTAKPPQPPEQLARYDELVATQPGLIRKGATIPYTSINGNMSSYLTENGSLVLRLGAADRTAFINAFGTGLHQAHGIVQKEYVDVPAGLFADVAAIAPWFARSVA